MGEARIAVWSGGGRMLHSGCDARAQARDAAESGGTGSEHGNNAAARSRRTAELQRERASVPEL
jgi:hypothetical protein